MPESTGSSNVTNENEDPSRLLGDHVLDVFFFGPLGLAVTAVEEFPRLAGLGRQRMETKVASARAIGQFAVMFGQSELKKRTEGWFGGGSPGSTAGSAPAGSDDRHTSNPAASDTGGTAPNGSSRTEQEAGRRPDLTLVPDEDDVSGPEPESVWTPVDELVGAGTEPSGSMDDVLPQAVPTLQSVTELAIPGYDTLSASQVVQRLDGLDEGDLRMVGEYEGSHRGRRTILNRVAQLLAGATEAS